MYTKMFMKAFHFLLYCKQENANSEQKTLKPDKGQLTSKDKT